MGALLGSTKQTSTKHRFDGHGGIRNESSSDSLPAICWAPSDEFPGHSVDSKPGLRSDLVRRSRISRSILTSMMQPDKLALYGMSITAIIAVGLVEANVVMNPELWSVQPGTAAHFVTRYACEQVLVSCVWGSQDAHILAVAMGLDQTAVLKAAFASTAPPTTAEDACAILRAQGTCAVRSIIATTLFLSQVLRSVSLGLRASDAFRERVRLGKEPVFSGTQQRVIRLCGRQSDVTEVDNAAPRAHTSPATHAPVLLSRALGTLPCRCLGAPEP